MVFRTELHADFELIRGGIPDRGRDFGLRPQELLGIPVALEAPLHEQRLRLEDQRHVADLAVTGGATDPFVHVR